MGKSKLITHKQRLQQLTKEYDKVNNKASQLQEYIYYHKSFNELNAEYQNLLRLELQQYETLAIIKDMKIDVFKREHKDKLEQN
jgi:hypothetical protein